MHVPKMHGQEILKKKHKKKQKQGQMRHGTTETTTRKPKIHKQNNN